MKYLITLICLLSILSCNNKVIKSDPDEKDTVIATWRGGQITLKEYEDFAMNYVFNNDSNTALSSTFDKRRGILMDMINFRLVELLADSVRLDTLNSMRVSYKRKLSGISYKHHLYPDSVRKKVIPECLVLETYNRLKFEYAVSHILLFSDDKTDKITKIKIDSIYSEILKTSDSFSNYAKRFSDDKASSENGGYIDYSPASNFETEFESQISKLKIGEISKPFKTRFGWHIAILRDKRRNKFIGSYEKEKAVIINSLTKKYQPELDKAEADLRIFLYNKYSVSLHRKNISQFVNQFNDLLKSNTDIKTGSAYFLKTNLLATFGDAGVSVEDALNYLSKIDKNKYPEITEKNINDFVFNSFRNKLSELIAEDLGYNSNPEAIKLAKEGMIIDYMEYFTGTFMGKEPEAEKWYKILHSTYNISINYPGFEEAFYIKTDDRK